MEGRGVYVRAGGARYQPPFVDGKMEGRGTVACVDDNASWDGTWSSNSAIGTGTWRFDNRSLY